MGPRSAIRLASFPALFLSHPTAVGRPGSNGEGKDARHRRDVEPDRRQIMLMLVMECLWAR